MKRIILLPFLVLYFNSAFAQSDDQIIYNIYAEQLSNRVGYENLEYLCKRIGHRINGSPQLSAAIEYTRQLMIDYQFDTVFLQPVMVPNWKRGEIEILRIINSPSVGTKRLNCLSLGNSIGTGPDGLTGGIVEVNGLDALNKSSKEQIQGKIVFVNKQIAAREFDVYEEHAKNIDIRMNSASLAAEKGAIAVIIRSLSTAYDQVPHTGVMFYDENRKKIPALSIGTSEADLLSDLLKKEPGTRLYIENHCANYGYILSYNVIGEIKGKEFPNEIIAVGGHIDSWDVGEGAQDDGAGCIQSIEVGRTFKALNLQPKRTIRVVLWVDEENEGNGGKEYAKRSELNSTKHIAVIESDLGGFLPLGFYIDTKNETALKTILTWQKHFHPYELFQFVEGSAGIDIAPLQDDDNLLLELKANLQHYGSLHHSEKDVFENVNGRELGLGAAAMTSIVYLIDKYGIK
jgi:hypothetical protein